MTRRVTGARVLVQGTVKTHKNSQEPTMQDAQYSWTDPAAYRAAGTVLYAARGITISATTLTEPTAGFVVARDKEHELVLPPGLDESDTTREILKYATRNAGLLRQAELYLGAWLRPDFRVVLDVVEVVPDLQVAILLGLLRGQEAIFDVALGHDLSLASPRAFLTNTYGPIRTYPVGV